MSKKQTTKSSTSVDHDAIAKLSWEQAIERLEEINDAIESGDLGLERSIDAYEEGVALRAHCEKILERAELRVTKLSPKDDDSGSGVSSTDEPDEPDRSERARLRRIAAAGDRNLGRPHES